MNKFSNSQILLLCGFLSIAFLIFDAALPLGVAGGFSYIFVILISLFSHQRNLIILAAIVASILTIIGVFISPLGGEFWPVFLNRCFALFAIWSTALLGLILQKTLSEKKQKEDEFYKIFELSPHIIGKGTLGGTFSEINSAVLKTLGYKKEAFLSTPFIDFVHKDDVEVTLSALEDAVKGKRNVIINNRLKCSDSNYKWFEWNVLATSENNTFYTVVRYVTERVFSERNANLSNKRLAEAKKTAHSKQIKRPNSSSTDSINGAPVIDNHNNNNKDNNKDNNKVIEGYNEITISQWSPEMTIDDGGVIDEDHQRLFNIFSRCQQLEENDDNFTTKIHALIKELTQYTVEHFSREELAMKVVDYPYSKNHCNIHKLMVKELNFIVKTESLQEIRLWIVTYLSDWLIDHIMVMDKVLESYIKANTGEVQRAMIELRAKEANQ